MNIAFYVNEMNYRGVANSTYKYAFYNEKILKNNSIIFFNKRNRSNKKDVIDRFKKEFTIIGVSEFSKINNYKEKMRLKYIYLQKGGEKDQMVSKKIKTIVHSMYPQKLKEIHGYKYAFISEWLSEKFSNKKIPYVPYMVENYKTKKNLKKELKISKKYTVLGCHGGESSFDLRFAQDSIIKATNQREDLFFLFLNIKKFCKHSRIKFLKGTANEKFKKEFVNTCDGMIYGRSLGESFGLACAEFATDDKIILSYKFNRHRSHKYHYSKNYFFEYSSFKNLTNILLNLKFKTKRKKIYNKYKAYSPKKVMFFFKKVFLLENKKINLSVKDYFLSYFNFFLMHYNYLRHKIYNHYYNYLESKIINFKR
jgi:hypothetical protein